MRERRKSSRAPILTQVEAQEDAFTALGRARNIGIGGLLVETRETLPLGSTVIVRFALPGHREPVQAAGQVVRVETGKSMAIAFLGLRKADEEQISSYVGRAKTSSEPVPLKESEDKSQQRRSVRIPRKIRVLLSWQNEKGLTQLEVVDTCLLSQHGAMVKAFAQLRPGQVLRVRVPHMGKNAMARVVWAMPSETLNPSEMGLEILGTADFWGVLFPFVP